MSEVMTAKEIRESLQKGITKAKTEMNALSKKYLESMTKENRAKESAARKRYNAFVSALEMSDAELVQNFETGNLLR